MNDVVTRWLAPDLHLVPAGPETEFDEAAVYEPVLRAPTLEEIQAIEDAAQQEGFARGHAEGFAQGQSEVRRLTAQIDGILDNFTHPLARLENEVVARSASWPCASSVSWSDVPIKPIRSCWPSWSAKRWMRSAVPAARSKSACTRTTSPRCCRIWRPAAPPRGPRHEPEPRRPACAR